MIHDKPSPFFGIPILRQEIVDRAPGRIPQRVLDRYADILFDPRGVERREAVGSWEAMTRRHQLLDDLVTGRTITATTDNGGGGGTRLCGIKLHASGSHKVAEFYLDERAVQAIAEDFASVEEVRQ